MNIANDSLTEYTGTSQYYQYLAGNVLTDGVYALAEKFHYYWLLDVICSYSDELKDQDFLPPRCVSHAPSFNNL